MWIVRGEELLCERSFFSGETFPWREALDLRILQTFGKCNIVECKLHVKPFRPRHGFSLRHDGARRGRERSSNLLVSGFMVELLRSWLSSGRRLRDNRTSNRIKLNDALSLPTEGHFANPIVHLHRNPTNDDLVAHWEQVECALVALVAFAIVARRALIF